MAEFSLKVGDLSPSITATLEDENRNAIDIQDALVTFILTLRIAESGEVIEGAEPIIEEVADNLQVAGQEDTNGQVEYLWTEGQTDIPGGYRGEWRVEFADGPGTFPNNRYLTIEIEPALGGGS